MLIVTARRTGVAFTIDPAHVAEVREYLGTLFYHLSGLWLTTGHLRRPGDSAFLLHLLLAPWFNMGQDYTLETLDVYTRENGTERVIIHQVNVRGLPLP